MRPQNQDRQSPFNEAYFGNTEGSVPVCTLIQNNSLFPPILQNVAWLTIERLTDGLQGGETDGLGLARFQDGEIGLRDADLLRQFL